MLIGIVSFDIKHFFNPENFRDYTNFIKETLKPILIQVIIGDVLDDNGERGGVGRQEQLID